MTQITAIKTFRPRTDKGTAITPGMTLSVTEEDAQAYINAGLAVRGTKALREHEEKMIRNFEDKGMRGKPEESADLRSGVGAPGPGAETAALRSGVTGRGRKENDPNPAVEHRRRSLRGE